MAKAMGAELHGGGAAQGAAGYAKWVARCAQKALLYEVLATPKPGLVDRANNGAHRDMDVFTFANSAVTLPAYFEAVVRRAQSHEGPAGQLLERLRPLGRRAEREMLLATRGVNTHKGAIFSLGIACAAAGLLWARGKPPAGGEVLTLCGEIAAPACDELARANSKSPRSHGEALYLAQGCRGVRGEAAGGFPGVRLHGLPVLRRRLARGDSLNGAGVAALLHLLANVEDSNILARGGDLAAIQAGIKQRLPALESSEDHLRYAAELDALFTGQNLSPGGCADLLAMCYLLWFLEN